MSDLETAAAVAGANRRALAAFGVPPPFIRLAPAVSSVADLRLPVLEAPGPSVSTPLYRQGERYPCCEHCQFDCPTADGMHMVRCWTCLNGLCASVDLAPDRYHETVVTLRDFVRAVDSDET